MNTQVTIVPARPELFVSQYDWFVSVIAERIYLSFLEPPRMVEVEEWTRAQSENGMIVFQAVSNGRVVGWCDVRPDPMEGFRHSGELGMGVHSDFRSQGIGKALIHTSIEAAWAAGLSRISLSVFASNERAIRLYRAAGFQVEVTQRRRRLLDAEYEDVLLMGLLKNE